MNLAEMRKAVIAMQVLVNFNAQDEVKCFSAEPRGEFLTISLEYSSVRDALAGEQLARFSQSRGRHVGSDNFLHARGQLPAGVTSATTDLEDALIHVAERGERGDKSFGSARGAGFGIGGGKCRHPRPGNLAVSLGVKCFALFAIARAQPTGVVKF